MSKRRKRQLLRKAYEKARATAMHHALVNVRCAHLGATLMIDGKICGTASNMKGIMNHAELRALRLKVVDQERVTVEIMIVRVTKINPYYPVSMAKPCSNCMKQIEQTPNVTSVYYTDWDGQLRYINFCKE